MGPLRVLNDVTRVKSVFKFVFDAALMDRSPRYGQEFRLPSASVLRRHKAKAPLKMFEAEERRTIIDGAGVPLKALLLLGLSCGFGSGDCASLPSSAVNLSPGWIDFPRPKTGIARRCPLWPETVAAIQDALAERPKPAGYPDCGLVFLTHRGTAWVQLGEKSRTVYLAVHFNAFLKPVTIHCSGFGFYTLRHVFRNLIRVGYKGVLAQRGRPAPQLKYVHSRSSVTRRSHQGNTRSHDQVQCSRWAVCPAGESHACNRSDGFTSVPRPHPKPSRRPQRRVKVAAPPTATCEANSAPEAGRQAAATQRNTLGIAGGHP